MTKDDMSHPKFIPHPSASNKRITWTSERNQVNNGYSSMILDTSQRLFKKLIDIFAKIERKRANKTPTLPFGFTSSFAVKTKTCLSSHLYGFKRQKTSIGFPMPRVNCKTNIPLENNSAKRVSANNVTEKEPELCFGDCSCGFSVLRIRKHCCKETDIFQKSTVSNCSCRHCFEENHFLRHRLRKNSRRRMITSRTRTSPFGVARDFGRLIFILLLLGIHFKLSSAIPIR